MAAGATLTNAARGRRAWPALPALLVPAGCGILGGDAADGSDAVRPVPPGFIYRPAYRQLAGRMPVATGQAR
jgi:hypothetical protein